MKNYIFGLLVLIGLLSTRAFGMGDGEIPLPKDYQSWSYFLENIQRPDVKQVRDIFMNPIAQTGTQDKGFPYGSEFVMENYSVKSGPDGKPLLNGKGDMEKDKLLSIFVMKKGVGYSKSAPEGLKNGDWIYASFNSEMKSNGKDMNACRACHLPLSKEDFVQRAQLYFDRYKK